MRKLEVIPGGLSTEDADEREKIFKGFIRDFKSTLKTRGVLDDFSLRKVVEEVKAGRPDFEGHEREVYEKIKDFLTNPEPSPLATEMARPIPDEKINRAA